MKSITEIKSTIGDNWNIVVSVFVKVNTSFFLSSQSNSRLSGSIFDASFPHLAHKLLLHMAGGFNFILGI